MRLDVSKLRQLDAFERAFITEYSNELLLLGASLSVSVEINNIIEITRPGAFGQSSKFFGEGFNVVVGKHLNPFFRRIGIGMVDFYSLGWQYNAFVGG